MGIETDPPLVRFGPILLPMRRAVSYQAPAKLNLALSIGPPLNCDGPTRGMHPICSWMVTINLFDDLHVTRLDNDRISRYAVLWHPDAKRCTEINWSITRDLAVRAHLALQERIGRALPVQMKLEKRIPVGSGLGGGSSDAAAMLRIMNELFELKLSIDELAEIGATLGSDVPFLVHGGSAIVEGLGEKITPQQPSHSQDSALHAVIAFPDVACPTAMVYARFDEAMKNTGAARLQTQRVAELAAGRFAGLSDGKMFNDLTKPAVDVAPQLENDMATVRAVANRPAHLSGSGSCIFVVCDNDSHAAAIASAIENDYGLPALAVRSIN